MGNAFAECYSSSFVEFEKRIRSALQPLQNTKLFVPTNYLYYFSGSQKSLTQLTHLFLYFFYIIELVLVLNIAEILLARR